MNGYEYEYGYDKPIKKSILAYQFFVLLSVIVIIILLLFKPCNCCCNKETVQTTPQPTTTIEYDDTDNSRDTHSLTAEDLDKIVRESMITMQMISQPVFANGTSKGNLGIYNDPKNNFPISVRIEVDGETVYQSKAIPRNKWINYAALDKPLKKGDYNALAYFNRLDEKTGAVLGTAAHEIVLHILN